MKKLVKVLAIALAATMLFALAACGNNPEGTYTVEKLVVKQGEDEMTVDFNNLTDEQKETHKNIGDTKVTKDEMISYDADGKEISRVKFEIDGKKMKFISAEGDGASVFNEDSVTVDITFDDKRITVKLLSEEGGVEMENTTILVKK